MRQRRKLPYWQLLAQERVQELVQVLVQVLLREQELVQEGVQEQCIHRNQEQQLLASKRCHASIRRSCSSRLHPTSFSSCGFLVHQRQ